MNDDDYWEILGVVCRVALYAGVLLDCGRPKYMTDEQRLIVPVSNIDQDTINELNNNLCVYIAGDEHLSTITTDYMPVFIKQQKEEK